MTSAFLPPEELESTGQLDQADLGSLLALASISVVGPAALLRVLHEGPAKSWAALTSGHPERSEALASLARDKLVREAAAIDPEEVLQRHLASDVVMVLRGDPGYPSRLREDPAAPVLLFASGPLGDLLSPHRPTVAVVGTRNATRVGREFATQIGRELSEAGVTVVSGLALGIDGAAHRGALQASGSDTPVVGVVASGLDITYPRRHSDLHQQVAHRGLLLSETPLGCRPTTWRFPARNRIIAALSDVVVVVESRAKGGSMLTADEAGGRGIEVMAVPGHPTSPASAGTNNLIASGSVLLSDTRDVLDVLGLATPGPAGHGRPRAVVDVQLDVRQRSVIDAIGDQPASLEEIVVRTHLTVEESARALTELEVQGLVSSSSGWYERSSSTGLRP